MKGSRKNAIITFDYEVFLGHKTGTVENSVLKPTMAILNVLKTNNAKAIFFVDTTWLLFLKENFPEDFKKVVSQLKEIESSGSSVELHLHPQWLDAEVINGQISFGTTIKYKLHSLSSEEIIDLFKRSIELLQSINGRKIQCFRAGGWCIEPFEKLKPAFDAFGIKFDSSVARGMYIKEGKVYDFDFTRAPKLPFYGFQDSVQKQQKDGRFIELPVSTYKNNPVYRLFNKLLLKITNDKIFGDGTGIKEMSYLSWKSVRHHFKIKNGMLTLDKNSNFFFRYLLISHFRRDPFLVIVSHPKIISQQALINLDYITRKYDTLNSQDLDLISR